MITLTELKATLEPNIAKDKTSECWAVQLSELSEPPTSLLIDQQAFRIRTAASTLAFRDALQSRARGDRLVILTTLSEHDLGEDILSRLGRHRVLTPARWEAVAERFRAVRIDPRLSSQKHLAAKILQSEPKEGFAFAPQGVLSAGHVWEHLFSHYFNWPLLPENWSDFFDCLHRCSPKESQELTEEAIVFLKEQIGGPVSEVWHHFARQTSLVSLAQGLVLEALLLAGEENQVVRALGRTEGLLGFQLEREKLRCWVEGSTKAWSRLSASEREHATQSALQFSKAAGAGPLLRYSTCFASSFEENFREFAGLCLSGDIKAAHKAYALCLGHQQGRTGAREIRLAKDILRAERFLEAPPSLPGGFLALANCHVQHGQYVESLIENLRITEPDDVVQALCTELSQRLDDWLGEFHRAFLEALPGGEPMESEIVPLERFHDRVLGPLVSDFRVLLVVMDGARLQDLGALGSSLAKLNWSRYTWDECRHFLTPFPSVTKLSRASLLSGKLQVGGQSDEKKGFSGHPALRAACQSSHPPLLFHKASVRFQVDSELADKVLNEKKKLIGVVVNVFDDLLDKGEQLSGLTQLEQIPPLQELLVLAARAHRVVVLISDHGHVVGGDTPGLTNSAGVTGGSRWRPVGGKLAKGEIDLEGSRVLNPDSRACEPLVFLRDRQSHYGRRAAGYHGGLHPSEVLAPFQLLAQPVHQQKLLELGCRQFFETAPLWTYPDVSTGDIVEHSGQTHLFAGHQRAQAKKFAQSKWLKARVKGDSEDKLLRFLELVEGYQSVPANFVLSQLSVTSEAEFKELLSPLHYEGKPITAFANGRVEMDWNLVSRLLAQEI